MSPVVDKAQRSGFIGALGGIRTPDPQIRSLVLYPAELRAPEAFLTKSAFEFHLSFARPHASHVVISRQAERAPSLARTQRSRAAGARGVVQPPRRASWRRGDGLGRYARRDDGENQPSRRW